MIFSAPRFVVVDDKEQHLQAITKTFQLLGSPCLGVRYDGTEELKKDLFRGVRCLFMDIHLIDGVASTDHRRHFANIAAILEDNISESGGPFILVVWTAHPDLEGQLRDYLDQHLDAQKPHARPLSVLGLAKEKFIDIDSGDVGNPEELRQAVQQTVVSNPQLAALFGWEAGVLSAAADTLASLLNLVPGDQRTSTAFPPALDTLLSRLVRETVGRSHVDANPRVAISMALAPILSDRILNQDVAAHMQDNWKKAVTRHADRSLEAASPSEAGEINRMLHLAAPSSETLRATDWGAVVSWPFAWRDDELKRLTGLTIKQMLCEEFRVRSEAINACKPVLIRVGAACDYAQNNRGPITFLFGVDIPENAERQKDSRAERIEKVRAELAELGADNKDGKLTGLAGDLAKAAATSDGRIKLTDAIWKSPVFLMPGATEVSRLHVHIRFPQTHLPEDCAQWNVTSRLREQLLMHLISVASNHVARPGIVQLPVE